MSRMKRMDPSGVQQEKCPVWTGLLFGMYVNMLGVNARVYVVYADVLGV